MKEQIRHQLEFSCTVEPGDKLRAGPSSDGGAFIDVTSEEGVSLSANDAVRLSNYLLDVVGQRRKFGADVPITHLDALLDGLVEMRSRLNSHDMKFLVEVAEALKAAYEPPRNFGAGVPGLIAEECYALCDLLISKNKAYGNAAFDPVRIFSKASTEEQLRVRLDDKLSRLARGQAAGEDVELDLLGYLILLRISRKLKPETSP